MDLLATAAWRYKEQDTWCTDPIMKKESLDLLQEVMKTAGELEKEAPYEALVDNSFAEKAVKNIKKD